MAGNGLPFLEDLFFRPRGILAISNSTENNPRYGRGTWKKRILPLSRKRERGRGEGFRVFLLKTYS